MTRTVILALGVLASLTLFAALYLFDPATASLFPPCPFHALTGLQCPGCGSLRAIHALLHGEGTRALGFNPLTTLAAPLLVAGVLRELCRWTLGTDPIRARAPAWTIWTLLVVMVGFAVLRNLTAFAWLGPG